METLIDSETGHLSEAAFYQRFPPRLALALVLGIVGCIYVPAITPFIAANLPAFAPLMRALFIAIAFVFAYAILNAIVVLGKPALEVDRAGLTFRRFRISWPRVTNIVPFRNGVGLVVDESIFVDEQPPRLRRLSPTKLMRTLLNRNGVLPIPPLRGIEVEALINLLNQVRRSVPERDAAGAARNVAPS